MTLKVTLIVLSRLRKKADKTLEWVVCIGSIKTMGSELLSSMYIVGIFGNLKDIIKYIVLFIYLFYILTEASSHPLFPVTLPYFLSPTSWSPPFSSPSMIVQISYEHQKIKEYQVAVRLSTSTCTQAGQGNPV